MLICALACLVLPRALAEGEALSVDFSVNPAEMVAPGDVTMTFIIENNTGFDVQNIYLSSADGLVSEPIGQLSAGERQTLVRPHTVTQEELDDGAVRYIISYDAAAPGGEKVSWMLSAYIVRGSARPDVDFTRQLSSRYVAPGGVLTVSYRLTNNGNVPVTDIQVSDSLGSFSSRLERLEVGATRTLINRVTVSAETESAAALEYSVPSGETFTRTLDPVPVRLSTSALDAEFSIGKSAFDPDRADAVLVLTNTGTDDYDDISVIDDVYGGIIADAVALPGGGSPVEISWAYPLRGGGEYRWRVTGSSQAGESLNFVTDTLTLEDSAAPASIGIELSAHARATKINRAGQVTFDLELRNTGTTMAEDLRLYEVTRGDIRNLAVLPTGTPTRLKVAYDVAESGQYTFCVNYTDAEGRVRTATSPTIDIEITPAGVAPEDPGGEEGAPRGASVKPGGSSTFTILLAVASAALISMFTILLVTSLRARKERRMRAAARRQRAANRSGASGKTGRIAALPAKDAPKKAGKKKSARQSRKLK